MIRKVVLLLTIVLPSFVFAEWVSNVPLTAEELEAANGVPQVDVVADASSQIEVSTTLTRSQISPELREKIQKILNMMGDPGIFQMYTEAFEYRYEVTNNSDTQLLINPENYGVATSPIYDILRGFQANIPPRSKLTIAFQLATSPETGPSFRYGNMNFAFLLESRFGFQGSIRYVIIVPGRWDTIYVPVENRISQLSPEDYYFFRPPVMFSQNR